jgi:hypothetical protein
LRGRAYAGIVGGVPTSPFRRTACAAAVAVALLAVAPGAMAKDGGRDSEVRVGGTCGRGAGSELRLRAKDGAIRVDFSVYRRARGAWRVVLVHERRVEWRGSVRSNSSYYEIRRWVNDLNGPDEVMMRATAPSGMTCTATATLPG